MTRKRKTLLLLLGICIIPIVTLTAQLIIDDLFYYTEDWVESISYLYDDVKFSVIMTVGLAFGFTFYLILLNVILHGLFFLINRSLGRTKKYWVYRLHIFSSGNDFSSLLLDYTFKYILFWFIGAACISALFFFNVW